MEKMEAFYDIYVPYQPNENCKSFLANEYIQDPGKQQAFDEGVGCVSIAQLPQEEQGKYTEIGDLEIEQEEETYVYMGELKQAILDSNSMQSQRKQRAYDEDTVYVSMGPSPQDEEVNGTEIGNMETEQERATCFHMEAVNQGDPVATEEIVQSSTNSNGANHDQNIDDNKKKLFLSAKDIEEKWRKVCEKTSQNMTKSRNDTVDAAISGQNMMFQRMRSQEAARVCKIAAFAGNLMRKKQALWGHKWENMYAVVFTNLMFIYKTELDAEPMGVTILDGYDIVIDERPGKTGFQLIPTLRNSVARPIQTFRCDKTDLKEWVRALGIQNERRLSKKQDAAHIDEASNYGYRTSGPEEYAHVVTGKEYLKQTKQSSLNGDLSECETNIYDVCLQVSETCLPPIPEKSIEKRKCLSVCEEQPLYENTPLRTSPRCIRKPLPERKPKAITM